VAFGKAQQSNEHEHVVQHLYFTKKQARKANQKPTERWELKNVVDDVGDEQAAVDSDGGLDSNEIRSV
jgi:hypothetical protein